MALSIPLSLPSVRATRIVFRAVSIIGESNSIYTGEGQYSVHQGEWFEADIAVPALERAEAEPFVGFLLACNGKENPFYMGDPVNIAPRGDITGTIIVSGSGQSGKTLVTSGGTGTIKTGDWFQLGTTTTSYLHKLVQDSADGTWEIWPRLRTPPDNATPILLASPKGRWKLATNTREWSLESVMRYGLFFSAKEDF